MSDVVISKKNEIEIHLDADPHIIREVSDAFSFEVEGKTFSPAYRKKFWDGRIRLLSTATQCMGAGLVYQLCRWLDNHDYNWEFEDNKFYGVPYEEDRKIVYEGVEWFMNNITHVKPRQYQTDTVFQCLREYRKTIVSPTGSGKSLMIYGISRYMETIGRRTLIIVPSKGLVEQMAGDFIDYGWSADHIHKIYQGHSLDTTSPVTISTWQSIYGLDNKWYRQFDCVIGDECHQYKAKSLQAIMKKCPDAKWRYGFTGTLDGKQVHKLILEGLFGPVYRTTSSSALMDKGFLAKLKCEIIILKHEARNFNNYNEEIEYLGDLAARNHFISDLTARLSGNVLVLFTRVEGHGIPLHSLISDTSGDRPVHLIYGDTKVTERERIRKVAETSHNNIILGSYGTMSTGVNIKNLHHVVFASPSKSRIRVLQSIGRGLRKAKGKESVMLYDIADDFRKQGGRNNFTLNHLAERIRYYVDEDFEYRVTEVPLNSLVGH
jgi:superfamily II DNA or RNA helicase